MDCLEAAIKRMRLTIAKCGYESGRGHISSALSLVEVLAVIYCGGIVNVEKIKEMTQDRDRIILSKAHAGLAQYAALIESGVIKPSCLEKFCDIDGILATHPEVGVIPGIEHTGGSLAQGIGFACGVAKAMKIQCPDARVYVVVGDGELQEGTTWEAVLFAAHFCLNNLVIIVDNNQRQIVGRTKSVLNVDCIADKMRAFGLDVSEVNGHDVLALRNVLEKRTSNTPRVIVANTIKGKGISFIEDKDGWHGRGLTQEEYIMAKEEIEND